MILLETATAADPEVAQHTEDTRCVSLTFLSCPLPPSPDLPIEGPNSRVPPAS